MLRLDMSRWLSLFVLIAALSCNALTNQAEQDKILGPGSFNYPDPRSGLGELTSYQESLTVTFDGTENRKNMQWTMTTVMTSSANHSVRILTIGRSENISSGEPTLLAEMDGAAYEVQSDDTCIANVLDPANSAVTWFEPAGQLSSVSGAEEAGKETIDGTETDHYKFDERALAQAGLNKSNGEMWIASEGGYLLRYQLTTEGEEDYFGDGVEGRMTWDYELSNVNQPIELQFPASCPPGMVDAPLLPDADGLLNLPSFLRYKTGSSVNEAAVFYQEQLPALGWELPSLTEPPEGVSPEEYQQMLEAMKALGTDQPTPPDPNADEITLEYQKDGRNLSVMITTTDGVTVVNLLLDWSETGS